MGGGDMGRVPCPIHLASYRVGPSPSAGAGSDSGGARAGGYGGWRGLWGVQGEGPSPSAGAGPDSGGARAGVRG